MSVSFPELWSVTGAFSVLLFLGGVGAFVLMLRQKRRGGACVSLLAAFLSLGLFQYAAALLNGTGNGPVLPAVAICAALTVGEAVLFAGITGHRKKRITLMSIKEATDSLPMGILCYAPNGRIILVNSAMKEFCKGLTGELLTDGLLFAEKMHTGPYLPGCKVIQTKEAFVLQLAGGTVWTVTEETIPYENTGVEAIMVSDISEEYRKTMELRKIQKEVSALNARLVKTNKEIVGLTAEQELFNAKVKIHDELGQNLLGIKRMILDGSVTETEKEEMVERLRENIDFLKKEPDAVSDEYGLMIGTAKELGVDVVVSGTLPQTEPLKHIVATGIHECFTNTLRHAHGNRLDICIREDEKDIIVEFRNNGKQPAGEICEKGGLGLLRSITERAGGQMTVSSDNILTITLLLPKEA